MDVYLLLLIKLTRLSWYLWNTMYKLSLFGLHHRLHQLRILSRMLWGKLQFVLGTQHLTYFTLHLCGHLGKDARQSLLKHYHLIHAVNGTGVCVLLGVIVLLVVHVVEKAHIELGIVLVKLILVSLCLIHEFLTIASVHIIIINVVIIIIVIFIIKI